MLKRGIVIMAVILLLATIAMSFPVSKAEARIRTVTGPWTLLRTLNDDIGYISEGDCPNWVSSPPPGTLNGTPRWYNVSIPLTAYAGKLVYIAFVFDTRDGVLNSYPGWFVKNVQVNRMTYDKSSQMALWRKCDSSNGPAWHYDGISWHYANPSTGNYQGNPIDDRCFDTWNWGSLVTPPVMVTRNSTLNFTTKWGIESVAPRGYDMMQIYVAAYQRGQPPCPIPYRPLRSAGPVSPRWH